jgi:hypothetical protein
MTKDSRTIPIGYSSIHSTIRLSLVDVRLQILVLPELLQLVELRK